MSHYPKSQIPNCNLRSALISAHRALLPPISHLTLLDIGLVVNLGLVALCLLLVAASAVSISYKVYLHTMMTTLFPVPEKERTPRLGRETGAGDFDFFWKTTWTHSQSYQGGSDRLPSVVPRLVYLLSLLHHLQGLIHHLVRLSYLNIIIYKCDQRNKQDRAEGDVWLPEH